MHTLVKKKKASTNCAVFDSYLCVEESNRPIFTTIHKTQLQVDQRPQHKTKYNKFYARESGGQS